MALDGSTAKSKLSSCVSPSLRAGRDDAGAHTVRLGTTQRHVDVEHMLDAAVVIRPAGLRNLIRLPILNAADDHIIEPDRDFLHRHAGHDPAADQQVVAVVDETGADGGIDLDPDRRRRGGLGLAACQAACWKLPRQPAALASLAGISRGVSRLVQRNRRLTLERARGAAMAGTGRDTDGAMPRL